MVAHSCKTAIIIYWNKYRQSNKGAYHKEFDTTKNKIYQDIVNYRVHISYKYNRSHKRILKICNYTTNALLNDAKEITETTNPSNLKLSWVWFLQTLFCTHQYSSIYWYYIRNENYISQYKNLPFLLIN